MSWALTIAGASITAKGGTLRIDWSANSRTTLTCDIESFAGSYRPTLGAETVAVMDAETLIGGSLEHYRERGLGEGGSSALLLEITAFDFAAILDYRYIAATFAAGQTLEDVLTALMVYWTPYGFTLDAGQVTGPTMGRLEFPGIRGGDVYRQLADLSGYVLEVSPTKVLRMFDPTTETCPFDVSTAGEEADGEIEVTRTRNGTANRIILKYGDATLKEFADVFACDGVEDTFTLSNSVDGPYPTTPDGVVGYGVVDTSYGTGTESIGGLSSTGLVWVYDPAAMTVYRASGAPSNGETVTVRYQSQFPKIVYAEDLADQATRGLVELAIEKPDIYDAAQAQAFADAELARSLSILTTVVYSTRQTGARPGQSQTITVATRSLSGDYLITQVSARDVGTYIRYKITAIGGSDFRGTWLDLYRQVFSLGTTQVAGATSVTDPSTVTTVDPESITEDVADQDVTLNATITGAAIIAAGTLTFTVLDGSTVIGSPITVAVVAGAASGDYTIPGGTAADTYTIRADYSGTPSLMASSDTDDLTIASSCTVIYDEAWAAGNSTASMKTGVYSVNSAPFDSQDSNYPNLTFAENVKVTVGGGPSGEDVLEPNQVSGSPSAVVSAAFFEKFGAIGAFLHLDVRALEIEYTVNYYLDSTIWTANAGYAPLLQVYARAETGNTDSFGSLAVPISVVLEQVSGDTYRYALTYASWNGSPVTVNSQTLSKTATEDASYEFKVIFKVASVNTGTWVAATDGYVQFYVNGSLIYDEQNVDFMTTYGGSVVSGARATYYNTMRGIAVGNAGLAGQVINMHLCSR